jgi:hypothetical protein
MSDETQAEQLPEPDLINSEETAIDDTTATEPEGEELVVTIDGETPPPEDEEQKHAPTWVKELRKQYREVSRRNRELEETLAKAKESNSPRNQLGAKPTLESCDYDADKYEAEITGWLERKRIVDSEASKAEENARAAQNAWTQKLQAYGENRTKLRVGDFEDAEFVVQNTLNSTQQGIILQGADNPALVIYALGKNQKELQKLSSITDPVQYAFAVSKLEAKLNVSKGKTAPPPEQTIRGTARVSGAVDSNLEKLRAEAEKTGDYSKVMRYKSQQKTKRN